MRDQELKNYLDERFVQVSERFTRIDSHLTQIDSHLAQIDDRFAQIDAKFVEVRAEIEATETRLLSEFWKWGRNAEQRVRRIEQSDWNIV